MSLVFYRKYRPQLFKEIIGQEHIIQTLKNAIANEMVSHAYLFTGPRGSGKTTTARVFAKAINCQNRKKGQSEPCDQCSSCLEIKEGHAIDLIEIDAASHTGIDEIRELQEGIKFSPAKSKYKIFILDEAHQLSKSAANALLKILEEPPSHAIFILATTEPHKMLPTIISRCQRFDFKKLSNEQIFGVLNSMAKKEGIKIEKNALETIVWQSQGSLRDAESLLEQIITFFTGIKGEITTQNIKEILGLSDFTIINQFCELLIEKKITDSINFINEIYERGIDLEEFLKALIDYLRRILILKITQIERIGSFAGFTNEETQKILLQAKKFSEAEIKKIIEIFLETQEKIKFSPIPQLPLELAVIDICQPQ